MTRSENITVIDSEGRQVRSFKILDPRRKIPFKPNTGYQAWIPGQGLFKPAEMKSKMLSNLQFHDYAAPQHCSISDHSLQPELHMYAASPNSLMMYEQEQCDMQNSLNSPIETENQNSQWNFDLKPQYECKADILENLKMPASLAASWEEPMRGDQTWSPIDDPSLLKMDDVYIREKSVENHTWSGTNETGVLKMEDIFRTDKSDVVHGPTLAELNCDSSLFDDIESVILNDTMSENKEAQSWQSMRQIEAAPTVKPVPSTPTCTITKAAFKEMVMQERGNQSRSSVPEKFAPLAERRRTTSNSENVDPAQNNKKSHLQQLLAQNPIENSIKAESLEKPQKTLKRPLSPRTRTSPTTVEKKWEEIKQFIHDEPAEFNTTSTEPQTKKIKTEPKDDFAFTVKDEVESNQGDDITDDEQESDNDKDYDLDSDLSDTESIGSHCSFSDDFIFGGKKEKRYFWQYNTQSKGPKGKRLCKSVDIRDPHILDGFEDPVFDESPSQTKYKHNGKARRGDGNDITPNVYKLYQIGNQLRRLSRLINDMTPVSELPVNARSKSRKEKNKLASRACRLKKKAQHEAHKVKLYGLDKEHTNLVEVLTKIKKDLFERASNPTAKYPDKLSDKLDKLIKNHLKDMIAGHTAEYVNSVLEKVSAGDRTGGLKRK